jgi:hypothetical protein
MDDLRVGGFLFPSPPEGACTLAQAETNNIKHIE